MRFKILMLTLACLWIAASAAQSFELGPQLAISVPTDDAGDALDLGINAGVTATFMETSTGGIGVDLGYHHWPGSSDLNAATDALLSRLSGREISGSKWTVSAFQATGHVKLLAPMSGPVAPWIQVGVGVYRVNVNLELLGKRSDNIMYEFGYMGGVGLDFWTSTRTKLGLDASYHFLNSKNDFRTNFTAFTIGTHLLFGRR